MDDGPAADPGSDPGVDADGAAGADADPESGAGAGGEATVDVAGESAVASDGEPPTGPGGAAAAGTGEPPPGLVTVRGAIYGVALLWLAAMAGFGAVQAAVYGATTATPYLLLAVAAAALSLTAGYASLRAFGLK